MTTTALPIGYLPALLVEFQNFLASCLPLLFEFQNVCMTLLPVIVIIIKMWMYILLHNYAMKLYIIIILYNVTSFLEKSTVFKLKRIDIVIIKSH